MRKSAKEWAADAIAVQGAVSMSGVVLAFARLMHVFSELGNRDTQWRNNHPICILFVTQVAHLAGTPIDAPLKYAWAYNWCADVAEGKRPDNYEYVEKVAA